MSNPIRFAVVGTGWRSEFMVRMAKAAPDRLEAVAVLARSDAAAEKISRRWGVPVVRSLDELLARGPEFVVAAVSWPSMPGVVTDLVERGAFVLAETPPAPTADGLRRCGPRLVRAVGFKWRNNTMLMPRHAARRNVLRSGAIGTPTSVEIASTHLYHATSIIRSYLGVGMAAATVTARTFVAPLADPLTFKGWQLDARPTPHTTTIGMIDFGNGRMGLYDFVENQWWNPLLARRLVIRGERGEIVDDTVTRLSDDGVIVSPISYRRTGIDMNLEGNEVVSASYEGRLVYENPWVGTSLSEDDIAVASFLKLTGAWARGEGAGPYSLADACQDHLLGLAIEEVGAHPLRCACCQRRMGLRAQAWCVGGAGRFTDDKFRRELHPAVGNLVAAGEREDQTGGLGRHADERLMDRGELRTHPAAQVDVIEPDDGQVFRNSQPALPGREIDSVRLLVGTADDRRGALFQVEQFSAVADAARGERIALANEPRVPFDSPAAESRRIAVQPVLVAFFVHRAGDESDAPMAEGQKVVGSVAPTGPVGRRDADERGCVGAHRIDQDDGDLQPREFVPRIVHKLRHNEDDSVCSPGGEALHPVGGTRRGAVGRRHNEIRADARRLRLGSAEQFQRPLAIKVHDDKINQRILASRFTSLVPTDFEEFLNLVAPWSGDSRRPLSTRETVGTDTPAILAISAKVALRSDTHPPSGCREIARY